MAEPVGVIFDLDGTLIDSAPDIHAAAQKVLATEGLAPMDHATVKGFVGLGVAVLISRILVAQDRDGDGLQHQRMVASFLNIYEEAVDLTKLYPGVASMLAQLEQLGHPMAICTNKPEAPTRAVLRHFGLLHHFHIIIGGDTLPVRKPDPMPLRLALTGLGTAKAVFVGDSEVDAETAHTTPLPFALFSGGYRKTPVQDLGAAVIFDNHADLPGLLHTIAH